MNEVLRVTSYCKNSRGWERNRGQRHRNRNRRRRYRGGGGYKEGEAFPGERPLSTPSHSRNCGLGTSDVIRLSAGHPSWAGLAKDAMTLKGDAPYVYATRLRQVQPSTKVKTFGEALDEMGFVPLDPSRRITLRRGGRANRLTHWRSQRSRTKLVTKTKP